jgi:ABC-2 type transport system ATP-binding protein
MPAILIDNLSKDFPVGFWRPRPYRALKQVSLSVEQGEVFGFLGPNGAGKTTTLKVLTQLIYPTSGRAEILGQPVGDLGVKRRIGYLPENPYFYEHLTAEELLTYFAGLLGYSGAQRRIRVPALLDQLGIGSERRMQLRKFSKGMLQRVGIAQAILNDPDVVLLDEPMSGLDPLGRRDVRDLILRLRDRGCTVFFSSHVLTDAEALCSRVAILAGGTVLAAGALADVRGLSSRGWELVVSNLSDDVLEHHRPRIQRAISAGDGHCTLQLSLESQPEALLRDLIAHGARLVSLNPIRESLEDSFVRLVTQHQARARDDARGAA